jgi:hypothetical protein
VSFLTGGVKRAGLLFLYKIIGEHELGDPRENAAH